jgi:hypothetical protein
MNVVLRTNLCIAFLTSAVGCQVCHPAFKNACAPDACGPEIHVRAPAQKVVVHRDDCPPPEAPCVEEKPAPVETKAAPTPPQTTAAPSPSPSAGNPAPQQMMVMGQPTQQQMMAQAGYAAIPTLPTKTALTITCDIIRIPIPIPRLRTVEIPPETKLSYVQIGGGGAIGAVAAPMPVAQQAAFVQPVGVQAVGAQGECIRPEHLAAAAAIVRAQNASAQSAPPNGASPAAAADPRLKVIEELERRCSELEQAKAAKSAEQGGAPPTNGAPPEGQWKAGAGK